MNCRGARIPDASSAPSSAFHVYDVYGFNVDHAQGDLQAIYAQPNNKIYMTQATGVDANTVAWAAAYAGSSSAKSASIVSNYEVLRPVAHGLRMTCPITPTTVNGFVHVALISMSTYGHATWSLPTTVGGMRELPFYQKYSLASLTQQPLVVVNKFLDSTAFRYHDSDSDELAQSAEGEYQIQSQWMGILCMVEASTAALAANILSVESIIHFEGQAKYAALNSDTKCPRMNAVISTAAQHAVSGHTAAAMQNTSEWSTRNSGMYNTFMNSVLRAGGTAIGAAIGRGVAGSVGNYVRQSVGRGHELLITSNNVG